jgi:hypothetical protein
MCIIPGAPRILGWSLTIRFVSQEGRLGSQNLVDVKRHLLIVTFVTRQFLFDKLSCI